MDRKSGTRALVALVVGLGILILAGVALVGVILAGRLAGGEAKGFGRVALSLPAGCAIAEASAAEGRLLLRLEGLAERGCNQVVILDLETGRELGRVAAEPE